MKNSKQIFDQLIKENLGYVDLQPVNNLESTPKTDFENKFAEYLAEEAKVEEKKVTKEVEEVQEHSFDYADKKNLDNQIGQEVLNGIYFEAKQNPDKTLDEIREIVSKNLAKDGQYYMNNAMFGIDGLKAETMKNEEVSGKHAASGYSDKVKEVVKESLMGGVVTSGNPNSISSIQNQVVKELMDEMEEGYGAEEYEKGKEAGEKEEKKKMKKAKKESLDTELAEIDKQANIVALEAKLNKMDEVIENKMTRINMVSEDENLAELMDKKKLKAMQKEVKVLEKRKAKMEKMYEKMCGKKYQREEIVDEVAEDQLFEQQKYDESGMVKNVQAKVAAFKDVVLPQEFKDVGGKADVPLDFIGFRSNEETTKRDDGSFSVSVFAKRSDNKPLLGLDKFIINTYVTADGEVDDQTWYPNFDEYGRVSSKKTPIEPREKFIEYIKNNLKK